jgi:hypothetical protein
MTKNGNLYLAYLLAVLACFPIGRYIFYFVLRDNSSLIEDGFVFERVYLSSPVLLITGAYIFFAHKKIHKVLGLLFFSIGFFWLIFLIRDLMSEAA